MRLALARGHQVRGMVRPQSARGRVPLSDEWIYVADMADPPERLAGAVAGMEAVIHCAAVTSEGAPDEALSRRVNVEGTRKLFEAARAAGVRRWVQISSMSAHPGSTSVYGRTKLGADEVLRAAGPPPAWTILRPSLIYGPGGKGLVEKTLQLMRKLPAVPVVGSGEEPIRPVYVDDVAAAALTCLEHEAAAGKTYMIGGADEISLNEFMRRLARARGLRRPLIHIPLPICFIMAKGLGVLVKNPPLTVDNVLGVRQAQRVDQTAAEREWGYRPIGFDEGLKRTFE